MPDMSDDGSLPALRKMASPANSKPQLPQDGESVVLFERGVWRSDSAVSDVAILPGSFNPIHQGHRQLRQAAERFLGCRVLYELSVCNVDKPVLAAEEVSVRLERIEDAPVLLTQAALFVDKARMFPGCWFVVGYDTAERILRPEYYRGDAGLRDEAMQRLRLLGVKFLVAGRLNLSHADAKFQTCDQLGLGLELNSMFTSLPESAFRVDVSSSDIRRRESRSD